MLAAVAEGVNLTFASILLTRISSLGVSVRVSVGSRRHISRVELRDVGQLLKQRERQRHRESKKWG